MIAHSRTPVVPTDRVSEVLTRDEALLEVFVRHAPHFEKLRNVALRRIMARLVTVEQAARMADVPVDALLRDLNAALHIESSEAVRAPVDDAGASSTENASRHPASLRQVELDLREDMRVGREPFSRIMAAIATLGPADVLLLRTIFEPVPLFGLMAKRGFRNEVERHSADDWSVWFWRGEGDVAAPAGSVAPDDTAGESGHHDGDEAERQTVWLDVRGLEPPQPLVRTLAALESLPDGHQLIQINARVPQFLLPMLSERGYACEVDSSDVDQVRVRIWRAPAH